MRVVFVGGGTGGHFYPLIAIAEQLRVLDTANATNIELYYIGPEPYNQASLDRLSITFVSCPAGKMRRYFSIKNILDVGSTIGGFFVAFWKLLLLYPDVVMSKGGYTSVPVIYAAFLLRIPIVIHESDAVPGRANKLAAPLARYIGIAHDDVATYFPKNKTALVGMPIRTFFFQDIPNPHAQIGIPNDRPVIFITGGSLGAERLNNYILATLPTLLHEYTVVHQTGDAHITSIQQDAAVLITDPTLRERYFPVGSLPGEDMAAALRAAVLVIARAGSTTLFEIALSGKPSIIIPIPESVSHDQRKNAYSYGHSGACSVVEEKNVTEHILNAEINRILTDKTVYETMQKAALAFTTPTAAYTLAETLWGIGKEHE